MRQFILISISLICLSLTAQEASISIASIYSHYTNKKSTFLKSKFNRKNALIKTEDFLKLINESLKSIQAVEKDITDLSPEGNQLALDIELIDPVRRLAKTKYKKADCELATHLNELNNQNEPTEREQINLIIKSLCK